MADQPIFWEDSIAFLKFSLVAITIGVTAYSLVHMLVSPGQWLRVAVVSLLLPVGAVSWALLARHRIKASVSVLGVGSWVMITVNAWFFGGVGGTSVIAYTLVILLFGWLVGARTLTYVTALTALVTLLLVAAEVWGYLPTYAPIHPASRWVTQCFTFMLCAVLISSVVRAYRSRLHEVRGLGDDLAQRTRLLQAAELDLNRAQSVAHIGSWTYDIPNDRMTLSPETCRIFGLRKRNTGSYKTYRQRVHADDRASTNAAWQVALANGTPFDNEHRIVLGRGVRWVRQRAEFEFDAAGQPLRAVGTTQDITERKQAETSLRENQSLLKGILSSTADGIVAVDRKGKVLLTNARFAQMWRVPASLLYTDDDQALLNLAINQVVDPDAFIGRVNELYASEAEAVDVLHFRDGRIFERFTGPLILNGVMVGRVWSYRDITQRLQAEAALRESESVLQGTLASTADGILAVDRDGKVLQANDRFAQLWRVPKSFVDGNDCQALLGYAADKVAEPEAFLLRVSQINASNDEATDTLHFEDGRILERYTAPLILGGAAVGRVWSFRDITQRTVAEAARRELEAQLRESQKMEALGTLAGGIAHDFNNALAVVMGNVELARQDLDDNHPARLSLDEIVKSSERSRALVQQILAFGRRQEFARKSMALAPVVEESVRLLRASLPAGSTLTLECAPDVPPVMADASQIAQVVVNLCTNAWHAIEGLPRAGLVDIRLHACVYEEGAPLNASSSFVQGKLQPGRYACLTVRDNGVGMDEATRRRIFEPYFTTKSVGKGTGLGLAVVHGVARGHDAIIEVDSTPGDGATFRLYFPAANGAAQAEGTVASNSAPARVTQDVSANSGRKILYVDDDEALVFLMTRLLERKGYQVSGFTEPDRAIAAIRENPVQYDLVVTDYNMPGVSGLTVVEEVKRIRADLPVAMVSGYLTDELREHARNVGVNELIFKPNTVDGLCEAVERLLK